MELGELYFYGEDVPKDYKKAVCWLWMCRERNIRAYHILGQIYYEGGYGVTKRLSKALEYFNESAEGGNSETQLLLGRMYCEGRIVLRNYYKAAYWIEKASENYFIKAAEMWEKYELWKYATMNKSEDTLNRCKELLEDLKGCLLKN